MHADFVCAYFLFSALEHTKEESKGLRDFRPGLVEKNQLPIIRIVHITLSLQLSFNPFYGRTFKIFHTTLSFELIQSSFGLRDMIYF